MMSDLCVWLQGSLFFVLKESFKIYKAISEGLINLADKFFEMDYLSAQKGLEIYKEAIVSSERLQVCFQPPAIYLATPVKGHFF
jgi:hypothetical protein